MGRVYVITGRDGVTLIDTSLAGAEHRIARELRSIGYQLSDVKRILITHAHPDHIGSLAVLKRASGASIYAHYRHESAVIRNEKPMLRPAQRNVTTRILSSLLHERQRVPLEVDRELHEGDQLDEVLPALEVIDTPGHSPGHCGFWQPEQRILFSGDVMLRIPFHLRLPMVAFTSDMDEAKRSIFKVAEMNVATLCPGHGKPYVGDAAPAIQAFVNTL